MTAPKTNLLPPLEPDEYEALKQSIAESGFWPSNPVVVDEAGDILDGHNRARACHELGIDYPTVTLDGLSEWEKVDYAVRSNVTRRQLSPAQRRSLLKRLKEEYDKVLKAEAAAAKKAGNARGGQAKSKSSLTETEPAATKQDRARSAGAEAAQTRFDEPVVAKPVPKDRLTTLAKMVGTSRATVARDEQVLDRMEKIETEAQRQNRDDVLRLLNKPRPNLDELERAVGLREPLPDIEPPDEDRMGWVANLAQALNHLSPALSAQEADALAEKVTDPTLALVQVGQLRGALAEAKQRMGK